MEMKNQRAFAKYFPILIAILLGVSSGLPAKKPAPQTAKVTLHTGLANCRVEMDGIVLGTTASSGELRNENTDPGDHYLHVDCPGKDDATYFISPRAGGEVEVDFTKNPPAAPASDDPTTIAANKARLSGLVQKAIQYRSHAQLDEAIAALREAMQLDPANSDLHREMGITYLLAKEWKRARVEMIEAIRGDHTDADAHNGLGYALEKLGDLDAALKEYHIATQLEPDDPSYRTHYYDAQVKIQMRDEQAK
jgi:tetratricopeptide (TPR) repeat protein